MYVGSIPFKFCPFGFICDSRLAEHLQPLTLLSRRRLELSIFRSSKPVTLFQWVDIGVFTLLHVTGRIIRPNRRLTVSLVIDPRSRSSTSHWTVPSHGSLARGSRFYKRYRLQDHILFIRRDLYLADSELCPTLAGFSLSSSNRDLYKIFSSRLDSRHNPAHAATYLNVYTRLGLGNFCSVLVISYSLPDYKQTLEWFSFILLGVLY